ncbi:MAG: fructose PTS transporter subunit IIA [Alicyclobacillus sp.]|nr:fructose PTS transporter subunit IIA [Alicyclobacillus sp.]
MMFEAANVLMAVDGASQEDVIRAVVRRAEELGKVTDAEQTVRAVLQREAESTTGFGKGVAIPHGKTSAVTEPVLLFAKLKQPVDWKSLDDQPVTMLFLILVPETSAAEHLKILAKLARKLMHDDFVEALRGFQTATELAAYVDAELA